MAKAKVELFDATLRLGGNLLHTLARKSITGKEITLLKAMHGNDAVVDVKKVGDTELDDREELFQLVRKYDTSSGLLTNSEGTRIIGRRLVERVFSVTLHDYDIWLEEQTQLEQMEREERAEKSRLEMAEIVRKQHLDAAAATLKAAGIIPAGEKAAAPADA